jgi:hypothetical protein
VNRDARRLLFLWLFLAALGISCPWTSAAEPAALADIVRANLRAQALLLGKLDVVYATKLPDGLHEGRWIADGPKLYSSHLVIGPAVIGIPAEAVWDGNSGSMRIGQGALFLVNDRQQLQLAARPPHFNITDNPRVGLGLTRPEAAVDECRIIPAATRRISPDEIELQFEFPALVGRREVVVFDRRVGYWPTKTTRLNDGKAIAIVAVRDFASGEFAGSKWWYPSVVETSVRGPDGREVDTYRYVVKNGWVYVGIEAPVERFKLLPMPNEWVYVTGGDSAPVAPTDKNWKPDVSSLKFPWSTWYAFAQNVDGLQSHRDELLRRFGADSDERPIASTASTQRSSTENKSYERLVRDTGLSSSSGARTWTWISIAAAGAILLAGLGVAITRRAVAGSR